jgi:hypothetical protein
VHIPDNDGYDAWVTLGAIAVSTQRIRFGTMITALARRRPWIVARQAATLDQLSNGRMILPVGLGTLDDGGFSNVGELQERKIRAERLDESLEIITGLWTGTPFAYAGTHYHIKEMTFTPPPVQKPRLPVWVVGAVDSPKSLGRALNYDGILPTKKDASGRYGSYGAVFPDDLRALREQINQHLERNPKPMPFEVAMEGETPGDRQDQAAEIIRPLAEAGLTWWNENVWGSPYEKGGVEGMRKRIQQGPPQVK